jgi:hypothetical protein
MSRPGPLAGIRILDLIRWSAITPVRWDLLSKMKMAKAAPISG